MTGKKERGYKLIRRQKGKPDRTVSFANTSSLNHMLQACADDGFDVLGDPETIVTPDDPDFISTTTIVVEPR